MKVFTGFVSILFALGFATSNFAEARHCSKGVACGNSCISKNDICHVGAGSSDNRGSSNNRESLRSRIFGSRNSPANNGRAVDTSTVKQESSSAMQTAKTKVCRKGKPCGNSCISEKAVCHSN